MTVSSQFEKQAPVWTQDGCLASVPANDNDPVHRAVRTPKISLAPVRVIALTGLAGSGKSTVSTFLAASYGYRLTKFAKPLKDMCRAIGMTEAMIEGNLKEVPIDWLGGKTPRHVMQTLGTEWGRDCIADDFWIKLWERSAESGNVVVDDCRFPNEAAAVRRLGGRVIRIVGRGGISNGHASEAGGFIADEVICNDGTIADLNRQAAEIIEGWR